LPPPNSAGRPLLSGARKLPIAASIALDMIGLTPGTVIRRSHAYSTRFANVRGQAFDALVKPVPIACQILDGAHYRQRQCVRALGEDAWQLCTQTAEALAHRNPAFQQEGANLIDDAGALPDQPFANPVQRLQVELLSRFGGDEFHR